MGAWDIGSFENDTALDWVGDFGGNPTLAFLRETLKKAAAADEIDADVASEALAAAEVVNVLLHPETSRDVDEDALAIAKKLASKPIDPDLGALALKAVERIEKSSELQELWDENPSPDWHEDVQALAAELRG